MLVYPGSCKERAMQINQLILTRHGKLKSIVHMLSLTVHDTRFEEGDDVIEVYLGCRIVIRVTVFVGSYGDCPVNISTSQQLQVNPWRMHKNKVREQNNPI